MSVIQRYRGFEAFLLFLGALSLIFIADIASASVLTTTDSLRLKRVMSQLSNVNLSIYDLAKKKLAAPVRGTVDTVLCLHQHADMIDKYIDHLRFIDPLVELAPNMIDGRDEEKVIELISRYLPSKLKYLETWPGVLKFWREERKDCGSDLMAAKLKEIPVILATAVSVARSILEKTRAPRGQSGVASKQE
jgi:hypothetical protein